MTDQERLFLATVAKADLETSYINSLPTISEVSGMIWSSITKLDIAILVTEQIPINFFDIAIPLMEQGSIVYWKQSFFKMINDEIFISRIPISLECRKALNSMNIGRQIPGCLFVGRQTP